jgi:hypothetical protein
MPSIAYKNAKAAATRAALNAQAEHRRAVLATRKATQRALAAAGSEDERQAALRKIHRSEKAWRIEQKYQACLMELEGCGASEIAARLGMTPGAVGNILTKAHRQRTEQTAKAIDFHRAILLERAEMIIAKFAPIALDDDLFGRIARGEPVSATSLKQAMRSALIMLAATDFQCRLLGLFAGNEKRRTQRVRMPKRRSAPGSSVRVGHRGVR